MSGKRNAERNRVKCREWNARLRRGEIILPELDWAICARGGSEAQARAHQRRGQKPCNACATAQREARERRKKRREAAA